MNERIIGDSAFQFVEIDLNRGEQVTIESGAMVYHNNKISLEGSLNANGSKGLGGVFKALGRSIVSGESMFITSAKATADDAILCIAPKMPGRVLKLEVGHIKWRLNDSAFLACDPTITYNLVRQSAGKALFAGTGGFFVMETDGYGELLVNTFGDMQVLELDGSNEYVVDNFHVVAWENSLDYHIEVASGTFGFMSGEGLVNRFVGRGKVIIQSRNIQTFASLIDPFITKSSGN
jgi:uncharacterized protein (TIGR00266 family)